jgi:methionyl-tRNA synthetase
MKDKKMSKSLGNLITPEELINQFGIDSSRYLIAASFPVRNDTSISFKRYIKKYNADLANGLGNLISRTAKLAEKVGLNFNEKVELKFFKNIQSNLEDFELPSALEIIWNKSPQGISATNQQFSQSKIWELKKPKRERELKKIITNLHLIAYNLRPFMPETAKIITQTFTGKISTPKPLFPRINN